MTKTFLYFLVLIPCAAVLAGCGTKPTLPPPPASPLSAAPPAVNGAPQGGRAMSYPSNPNRPANIPALGIPANARRSHAAGQ